MFTWICPQCGREVLPSQNECPSCAEKAAEEAAKKAGVAAPAPPAAPATPAAAPSPAPAAPAPSIPPPSYAAPAPASTGMPGWAVTLLVAGALVAVGAGAYYYLLPSSRGTHEKAAEKVELESPAAKGATPVGGKVHPYGKHLEVGGLRITEDAKQKLQVRFALVNHSAADMAGVALTVELKTVGEKGKTIAEFPVVVGSVGPYEVKDVTASVPTKLRAYELPDWQFLRAEFQVTAP